MMPSLQKLNTILEHKCLKIAVRKKNVLVKVKLQLIFDFESTILAVFALHLCTKCNHFFGVHSILAKHLAL